MLEASAIRQAECDAHGGREALGALVSLGNPILPIFGMREEPIEGEHFVEWMPD